MGTVYEAIDETIGRHVAIKLINGSGQTEESRTRFRREAQALSAIDHPHIVRIFQYGTCSDYQPYMVMELLAGTTLRHLLNEQERIPLLRTLEIAEQIADGVNAAHELGIVHRDLKPNNIFITSDKQVKIIDFGLCKVAAGQQDQKLTDTGLLVGSVHYMSPEMCQGLAATTSTDIYSLGILIFELITGQPPFIFDSPIGLLYLHANAPIPLLEEHYPLLSHTRPVDEILARCLAKDPSDRFSSMSDLKSALAELRKQITEFSESTRCPTKVRSITRRVSIAGAIFVCLCGIALLVPRVGTSILMAPTMVMGKQSLDYVISLAELCQITGMTGYRTELVNAAQRLAGGPLSSAKLFSRMAQIGIQQGDSLTAQSYAQRALTTIASISTVLSRSDQDRLMPILRPCCAILQSAVGAKRGPSSASMLQLCDEVLQVCERNARIKEKVPVYRLRAEVLRSGYQIDYCWTLLGLSYAIQNSSGPIDEAAEYLEKALAIAIRSEGTLPYLIVNSLIRIDCDKEDYQLANHHLQKVSALKFSNFESAVLLSWRAYILAMSGRSMEREKVLDSMMRLGRSLSPTQQNQLFDKVEWTITSRPNNIGSRSRDSCFFEEKVFKEILSWRQSPCHPDYEILEFVSALHRVGHRFKTAWHYLELAERNIWNSGSKTVKKVDLRLQQTAFLLRVGEVNKAKEFLQEARRLRTQVPRSDDAKALLEERFIRIEEMILEAKYKRPYLGIVDY